METIAGLISIQLHLDKIIDQYQLHIVALPKQYTINSLLDNHYSKKTTPHHITTSYLIDKQWLKIKSPIIDINTYLNEVIPSFDSLNKEFSLGFCLINTFSNWFSFLSFNQKDIDILRTHCNRLNNVYEDSLKNQNIILVIADICIKNNIATLISHVYKDYNIINKSIYYAMNVNSIEAELFAIKYKIDQAMKL